MRKYRKAGIHLGPGFWIHEFQKSQRQRHFQEYCSKLVDNARATGIVIPEVIRPVDLFEVFTDHLYTQFEDFLPSSGDVIIDVGAQYGDYSILCSTVYRVSQVFAFEPLKNAYEVFQEFIALNNVTNVMVNNIAIGSYDGIIQGKDDGHMFGVVMDGFNRTSVQVRTLDSFGFQKIDLLKIDVEGFEMEVLKGAKETISRCRPRIIIETHSSELEQLVRDVMSSSGHIMRHCVSNPSCRTIGMDRVRNLFFEPSP
ncbi:MAG: FkbM family methyltransferase [Thermoplasmataceae archaeon]